MKSLLNNLRVRLVLWTVMFETVLVLLAVTIVVFYVRGSQNQQVDSTLRLSADQLTTGVSIRGSEFDFAPSVIPQLLARGVLAWVLTPENTVASTIGDAAGLALPAELPPAGQFSDYNLTNGRGIRLLRVTLNEDARAVGTLLLGIPVDKREDFLRQVILGFGVALPLVLALSGAGGLFLANRALAPVAVITNTARQLSASELSQRIDLKLPDDELGRLVVTFNGMLQRLDDAFERERQLTSDVSHELRTPLGMLKLQLSIARSRPRDAAELFQMMQGMEGDVDRMTSLVEQMLTLARIEQQTSRETIAVALVPLLEATVAQEQPSAAQGQIALRLTLPTTNPVVSGDEDQLRQVFTNLIDNAIKYTGAPGSVTLTVEETGNTVRVDVADTGAGISAEALPHLFERFYRVEDARTGGAGGFGLGLAITRALVQAHGGDIQVKSQPGKGSTFTVTLPIFRLDSGDEPE